jgi:hypothetical protein
MIKYIESLLHHPLIKLSKYVDIVFDILYENYIFLSMMTSYHKLNCSLKSLLLNITFEQHFSV